MEFLRKLNEEGVTVVMITHDMHLMLEYSPRALVFADGRLIADDSAAAVLCNQELVERAALKETSLFTLANRAGITPPEAFVECFIEEDREVRSHGRQYGIKLSAKGKCSSQTHRNYQAGIFPVIYLRQHDHLQHLGASGTFGGEYLSVQTQQDPLQRSPFYDAFHACFSIVE